MFISRFSASTFYSLPLLFRFAICWLHFHFYSSDLAAIDHCGRLNSLEPPVSTARNFLFNMTFLWGASLYRPGTIFTIVLYLFRLIPSFFFAPSRNKSAFYFKYLLAGLCVFL